MSQRKILNRVRSGDLTVLDALAELGEKLDASAARTLTQLADESEVEPLFAAAQAADADRGSYRPTQLNVAFGLIESGKLDQILNHDWRLRDLLGIVASTEPLPESSARRSLYETLSSKLSARLDDGDPPGFHELLSLLAIKHSIQHLRAEVRDRFLDWFAPFVQQAEDNDEFMELDYPYGQVDPCIELARAYALAGRSDDSVRWLKSRKKKWAKMMHFDELLDLSALVEALPQPERDEWWATLRNWARIADRSGFPHEGESLETEWLVRTKAPDDVDADAALLDAIDTADLPQRLASVLDSSSSPAVGEAAIEKTVTLAERLLKDIVESAPNDFNRRAPAIRGLRSAAHTLDDHHHELSSEQQETVSAIARRWAAWFVDYETGDLLPHYYTAIAFAGHWRDEVEPVAAMLKAELDEGHSSLFTYQGWERLFSEEELAELG